MSDYISREAATADSDRNKIKTPFAGIVVEGTPGKPYANARGYKGEAVCVEMNGFCSYGERRKSNEDYPR